MHAQNFSELISFDFIYIFESWKKNDYVLIIKDDFSSYVFLHSFKNANLPTTSNTLME